VKPSSIQSLFERLRAANPDPRSELAFSTPYQLLVAVILSAQATDKSVNLATPGLFAAAPSPAAMVRLGRKGIERQIRRIGLYRTKSKNLWEACCW
jgi:endonuclease-3